MKGYTNYVVTIKVGEKYYSFFDRIANCNNLMSFIKRWEKQYGGEVYTMNAVKSATEAAYIAVDWNYTYRQNGTCLYD